MPYIDFADVEKLATIEQLANMLNLNARKSGMQLRCSCPVHGGERSLAISPQVRSKRGSLGVFYCQEAKQGGDRISLVAHCMDIGQQDAAFFIQEQFGTDAADAEEVATLPEKKESREPTRPPASKGFDPNQFAAKFSYDGEVADLSSEVAKAHRIGVHRGKLYIPVCPPDVKPVCFAELHNGQLRLPDKWLSPNVIAFKRPA